MKNPPLLLLAFCCIFSVRVQAQDVDKTRVDEDDARITTVSARQDAAANLLTMGQQLHAAGNELEAARAWNRAGRFQLQLNQPDDALATYNNALKDAASDPATRIDSLNGLARANQHLSKCAEAKPLIQQAVTQSEQAGYIEGKAEAFLIAADCESSKKAALAYSEQAVELWKSTGRKLGIARAYLVLGEFQMVQNRLMESTQSFQSALELWRELNVPRQMAEALINLGFIEYRKGAWQASLSFYMDARPLIDEQAEPYMIGQIAAGLAEAFLESGLPDSGLDRYQEALEYFRLTKKPTAIVGTEWGIGRTQYLRGHYAEALQILESARSEALAIKELMIAALCDDFMGRTYYEMNDYASALKHYQTALDGFGESENPMEAARILAFMGQVYQAQGSLARAKANYQKALLTFHRLSDQVNESATLYALGALELKQGAVDDAAEHLRQSIQMTEEMRRVSTSSDLTSAFSARVHDRYEKYIDCMMRKFRRSGSKDLEIKAFETSELARARSLTELLRATQANPFPNVDPQLALKEKQVRESLQINENARVALLSSNDKTDKRPELARLDSEYEQLKTQHADVLDAIRRADPGYEQIIRPTAWELSKIQDQLLADDQTVLLEYSLGSESSYLWATTRSGFKSYKLPGEDKIIALANRVYKLLEATPLSASETDLNNAINELAQVVLFPASEQLGYRRIIVVPDGVLNYIPFQILPATTNGEPLVADKEIVNAPSATTLGELQREAATRRPARNLLAAFGDPVFADTYTVAETGETSEQLVATARLRSALRDTELNGDSFDPATVGRLFYAKRELDGLREVAGDNAVIASEYDATREQFLHTDLTQFTMLHFATHGLFDPKKPESSGLLLSTVNREGKQLDGFLQLRQIYELRAPVLLVVLSACKTALGRDVRGEGLLGITRGFMYAGASSVVASLWNVDDAATAELMRLFYSNMLQRGMKPAEALRAAQNSIRQQPDWHSPHYWAAFTLQGDYRQVIEAKPTVRGWTFPWKISILLAVIIVGGVVWLYRRQLWPAKS
jgi:CHAT domain-containing protein